MPRVRLLVDDATVLDSDKIISTVKGFFKRVKFSLDECDNFETFWTDGARVLYLKNSARHWKDQAEHWRAANWEKPPE